MAMRVSGINSGLDTEALVKELVSAYSKKTEKYEKQQTKLSWKQDSWKAMNTKVYGLYTNISNLRFSGAYSTKKASSSNTAKATVTATSGAVTGTQKLRVLSVAQTAYLTGSKMSTKDGSELSTDTTMKQLGFEGEEGTKLKLKTKDENGQDVITDIEITEDTKVTDVVDALKKQGINANFDTKNGRLYLSGKDSGEKYNFEISTDSEDAEASQKALEALGLKIDENDEDAAKMIQGTDAKIRLSGVLYTSSNNNFSINGLNIVAQGVTGDTEDNEITVTVANDSQAIYDKIKDFLTEYNEVINEMTKAYNAKSSGDYEPLTDEEKDAMSDTEVEKWETKIKDALLRRDTTLNSVMSAMQTAMATGVKVGDKTYSLSSFGIHTLGFLNAAENEQNAYHIDGDEDDSNTSGNKDKLMDAIVNDPDSVVEFMKGLTTNLYKAIDEKMKSTSLSSAYTIYNDKELTKQYDNLTKTISQWEKRVSEKEDFYYKKFSAMESALAKLNSQQSSMSGLFGSN